MLHCVPILIKTQQTAAGELERSFDPISDNLKATDILEVNMQADEEKTACGLSFGFVRN